MTIKNEFPPNYAEIAEAFDLTGVKPVFSYRPFLYNPHNCPIPDHLLTHELVHQEQQQDPKAWWNRYLEDRDFRLEQELAAYRAQYQFGKKWIKDRNTLFRFLDALATELSGKMYGEIIGRDEALHLIEK